MAQLDNNATKPQPNNTNFDFSILNKTDNSSQNNTSNSNQNNTSNNSQNKPDFDFNILNKPDNTTLPTPQISNINQSRYTGFGFTANTDVNNDMIAGKKQGILSQLGRGVLSLAPSVLGGTLNIAGSILNLAGNLAYGFWSGNEFNNNILNYLGEKVTSYSDNEHEGLFDPNPQGMSLTHTMNFISNTAGFVVPFAIANIFTYGAVSGVSSLTGMLLETGEEIGNAGEVASNINNIGKNVSEFLTNANKSLSIQQKIEPFLASALWSQQTSQEVYNNVKKTAFQKALNSGASIQDAENISQQNANDAGRNTFITQMVLNSAISEFGNLLFKNKLSSNVLSDILQNKSVSNDAESILKQIPDEIDNKTQEYRKALLKEKIWHMGEGALHMSMASVAEKSGIQSGNEKSLQDIYNDTNNILFQPDKDTEFISNSIDSLKNEFGTTQGLSDTVKGLFLGIGMDVITRKIPLYKHIAFDENFKINGPIDYINEVDKDGNPVMSKDENGKEIQVKKPVFKYKIYSASKLDKFNRAQIFNNPFDALKTDLERMIKNKKAIDEFNSQISVSTDEMKTKKLIDKRDELINDMTNTSQRYAIFYNGTQHLKNLYDSILNIDNTTDINKQKRDDLKQQTDDIKNKIDNEQDETEKQNLIKQLNDLQEQAKQYDKVETEATKGGYAINPDVDIDGNILNEKDKKFKETLENAQLYKDNLDKYEKLYNAWQNILNKKNNFEGDLKVKQALEWKMEYDMLNRQLENIKKNYSGIKDSDPNDISNPINLILQHISKFKELNKTIRLMDILNSLNRDEDGNIIFNEESNGKNFSIVKDDLKKEYNINNIKELENSYRDISRSLSSIKADNDNDLIKNIKDEYHRQLDELNKSDISSTMYNSNEYNEFLEKNKHLTPNTPESNDAFEKYLSQKYDKYIYENMQMQRINIRNSTLSYYIDLLFNDAKAESYSSKRNKSFIADIAKKINDYYKEEKEKYVKELEDFYNNNFKLLQDENALIINTGNDLFNTIKEYHAELEDNMKESAKLHNHLNLVFKVGKLNAEIIKELDNRIELISNNIKDGVGDKDMLTKELIDLNKQKEDILNQKNTTATDDLIHIINNIKYLRNKFDNLDNENKVLSSKNLKILNALNILKEKSDNVHKRAKIINDNYTVDNGNNNDVNNKIKEEKKIIEAQQEKNNNINKNLLDLQLKLSILLNQISNTYDVNVIKSFKDFLNKLKNYDGDGEIKIEDNISNFKNLLLDIVNTYKNLKNISNDKIPDISNINIIPKTPLAKSDFSNDLFNSLQSTIQKLLELPTALTKEQFDEFKQTINNNLIHYMNSQLPIEYLGDGKENKYKLNDLINKKITDISHIGDNLKSYLSLFDNQLKHIKNIIENNKPAIDDIDYIKKVNDYFNEFTREYNKLNEIQDAINIILDTIPDREGNNNATTTTTYKDKEGNEQRTPNNLMFDILHGSKPDNISFELPTRELFNKELIANNVNLNGKTYDDFFDDTDENNIKLKSGVLAHEIPIAKFINGQFFEWLETPQQMKLVSLDGIGAYDANYNLRKQFTENNISKLTNKIKEIKLKEIKSKEINQNDNNLLDANKIGNFKVYKINNKLYGVSFDNGDIDNDFKFIKNEKGEYVYENNKIKFYNPKNNASVFRIRNASLSDDLGEQNKKAQNTLLTLINNLKNATNVADRENAIINIKKFVRASVYDNNDIKLSDSNITIKGSDNHDIDSLYELLKKGGNGKKDMINNLANINGKVLISFTDLINEGRITTSADPKIVKYLDKDTLLFNSNPTIIYEPINNENKDNENKDNENIEPIKNNSINYFSNIENKLKKLRALGDKFESLKDNSIIKNFISDTNNDLYNNITDVNGQYFNLLSDSEKLKYSYELFKKDKSSILIGNRLFKIDIKQEEIIDNYKRILANNILNKVISRNFVEEKDISNISQKLLSGEKYKDNAVLTDDDKNNLLNIIKEDIKQIPLNDIIDIIKRDSNIDDLKKQLNIDNDNENDTLKHFYLSRLIVANDLLQVMQLNKYKNENIAHLSDIDYIEMNNINPYEKIKYLVHNNLNDKIYISDELYNKILNNSKLNGDKIDNQLIGLGNSGILDGNFLNVKDNEELEKFMKDNGIDMLIPKNNLLSNFDDNHEANIFKNKSLQGKISIEDKAKLINEFPLSFIKIKKEIYPINSLEGSNNYKKYNEILQKTIEANKKYILNNFNKKEINDAIDNHIVSNELSKQLLADIYKIKLFDEAPISENENNGEKINNIDNDIIKALKNYIYLNNNSLSNIGLDEHSMPLLIAALSLHGNNNIILEQFLKLFDNNLMRHLLFNNESGDIYTTIDNFIKQKENNQQVYNPKIKNESGKIYNEKNKLPIVDNDNKEITFNNNDLDEIKKIKDVNSINDKNIDKYKNYLNLMKELYKIARTLSSIKDFDDLTKNSDISKRDLFDKLYNLHNEPHTMDYIIKDKNRAELLQSLKQKNFKDFDKIFAYFNNDKRFTADDIYEINNIFDNYKRGLISENIILFPDLSDNNKNFSNYLIYKALLFDNNNENSLINQFNRLKDKDKDSTLLNSLSIKDNMLVANDNIDIDKIHSEIKNIFDNNIEDKKEFVLNLLMAAHIKVDKNFDMMQLIPNEILERYKVNDTLDSISNEIDNNEELNSKLLQYVKLNFLDNKYNANDINLISEDSILKDNAGELPKQELPNELPQQELPNELKQQELPNELKPNPLSNTIIDIVNNLNNTQTGENVKLLLKGIVNNQLFTSNIDNQAIADCLLSYEKIDGANGSFSYDSNGRPTIKIDNTKVKSDQFHSAVLLHEIMHLMFDKITKLKDNDKLKEQYDKLKELHPEFIKILEEYDKFRKEKLEEVNQELNNNEKELEEVNKKLSFLNSLNNTNEENKQLLQKKQNLEETIEKLKSYAKSMSSLSEFTAEFLAPTQKSKLSDYLNTKKSIFEKIKDKIKKIFKSMLGIGSGTDAERALDYIITLKQKFNVIENDGSNYSNDNIIKKLINDPSFSSLNPDELKLESSNNDKGLTWDYIKTKFENLYLNKNELNIEINKTINKLYDEGNKYPKYYRDTINNIIDKINQINNTADWRTKNSIINGLKDILFISNLQRINNGILYNDMGNIAKDKLKNILSLIEKNIKYNDSISYINSVTEFLNGIKPLLNFTIDNQAINDVSLLNKEYRKKYGLDFIVADDDIRKLISNLDNIIKNKVNSKVSEILNKNLPDVNTKDLANNQFNKVSWFDANYKSLANINHPIAQFIFKIIEDLNHQYKFNIIRNESHIKTVLMPLINKLPEEYKKNIFGRDKFGNKILLSVIDHDRYEQAIKKSFNKENYNEIVKALQDNGINILDINKLVDKEEQEKNGIKYYNYVVKQEKVDNLKKELLTKYKGDKFEVEKIIYTLIQKIEARNQRLNEKLDEKLDTKLNKKLDIKDIEDIKDIINLYDFENNDKNLSNKSHRYNLLDTLPILPSDMYVNKNVSENLLSSDALYLIKKFMSNDDNYFPILYKKGYTDVGNTLNNYGDKFSKFAKSLISKNTISKNNNIPLLDSMESIELRQLKDEYKQLDKIDQDKLSNDEKLKIENRKNEILQKTNEINNKNSENDIETILNSYNDNYNNYLKKKKINNEMSLLNNYVKDTLGDNNLSTAIEKQIRYNSLGSVDTPTDITSKTARYAIQNKENKKLSEEAKSLIEERTKLKLKQLNSTLNYNETQELTKIDKRLNQLDSMKFYLSGDQAILSLMKLKNFTTFYGNIFSPLKTHIMGNYTDWSNMLALNGTEKYNGILKHYNDSKLKITKLLMRMNAGINDSEVKKMINTINASGIMGIERKNITNPEKEQHVKALYKDALKNPYALFTQSDIGRRYAIFQSFARFFKVVDGDGNKISFYDGIGENGVFDLEKNGLNGKKYSDMSDSEKADAMKQVNDLHSNIASRVNEYITQNDIDSVVAGNNKIVNLILTQYKRWVLPAVKVRLGSLTESAISGDKSEGYIKTFGKLFMDNKEDNNIFMATYSTLLDLKNSLFNYQKFTNSKGGSGDGGKMLQDYQIKNMRKMALDLSVLLISSIGLYSLAGLVQSVNDDDRSKLKIALNTIYNMSQENNQYFSPVSFSHSVIDQVAFIKQLKDIEDVLKNSSSLIFNHDDNNIDRELSSIYKVTPLLSQFRTLKVYERYLLSSLNY